MRSAGWITTAVMLAVGQLAWAEKLLPPIDVRYAAADVQETPSFQKHVVPLFSRLGCNGRACHGSFQGRGGFRLSLFGYDFQSDHDALFDADSLRVDREQPLESLILNKPTDAEMHEGGLRYKRDAWQYRVFHRWIESGAEFDRQRIVKLIRLDVTPHEILFSSPKAQTQLQAVAVWEDGTREDVTPLCRFKSNDDQVAQVGEQGLVTAQQGGDTHVVISYDRAVVPVPVIRPLSDLVGSRYPQVATPTRIDELVVEKLRKLGIVPSPLCSDAEFLRRVKLDIAGTLPTVAETEAFLADDTPHKRGRKIDELLESPAYAAWWTTKLCDFTGNNDDQLRNSLPTQSGSQDWYSWIHRRVAENVPYDQLAAGMITATSRQEGQGYREYCEVMSSFYDEDSDKTYADLPSNPLYWARRDFREPEARAIGFAYAFMGIRIQCAQCHKHPFDQWSKEDFHLFKNFFSGVVASNGANRKGSKQEYKQLVEELGLTDKRGGQLRRQLGKLVRQGKVVPFPEVLVGRPRASRQYRDFPADTARLLGGETFEIKKHEDPRQIVMEWLRSKDNRFFARAFVNRVWASYFNVGIVDPPDDNSLANPAINQPLLDFLAKGFIESGFDMKWVHRTIAKSHTYQRSWRPNDTNARDERNYSRAIPRRLPAEVVYDAIQQALASDARIARLQEDVAARAISIPGSSSRSRGRDADRRFALTVFGRSTRESNCDCDRSADASLLQTVYLQNDKSVLELLETGRGTWLSELANQLLPHSDPENPRQARRLAGLRKQLAGLEAKADKLLATGNREAASRLERRMTNLDKQIKRVTPPPPEGVQVTTQQLRELVQQAYLRTLNRHPNESEMARCQQYLAEAKDPIAGTRDLLWALVNTKEFIVNH